MYALFYKMHFYCLQFNFSHVTNLFNGLIDFLRHLTVTLTYLL